MKSDTQTIEKVADDLKTCLLGSLKKDGVERQLTRELCRQKLNELRDIMELTHDDHEAIDNAIDKDENIAITLIDRALDFYRPE